MKIAIVHNDYGKFSGEEAVVRDHIALLREAGERVCEFRRSSAELHGISGCSKGFFSGIWNPFSQRRFGRFLDSEKPDIVHVHNLYPLISPCVLPECRKRKIPVVMTLHNFRLVCPCGLFFHHGQVCETCAKKKSELFCIAKNCESSFAKSTGYALRSMAARLRGDYINNVDRFLCLTEFQMSKLISYGLSAEKCRLIPNFISDSWLKQASTINEGNSAYIAYMGRLSQEKGIPLLLEAARRLPDIPFKIAGNGFEEFQAKKSDNVEFVGYITGEKQFELMHHAAIHLMTSLVYENFPTSLLQGMALGVVSVVPDHGGMPWIIGDGGKTFQSGNPEHLAKVLRELWSNATLRHHLGEQGRSRCHAKFAPEQVKKQLLDVYRELM